MANQVEIIAEPGALDLFVIREFEAPRELVFRAHTDAELYRRWLGPREITMSVDVFEPRDGGRYRFFYRGDDGREFAFHGVHHEVLAPERIIHTMEFEGMPEPGHVMMTTLKLEALPGDRTRMVAQYLFQSVEDRDSLHRSGMQEGVEQGYQHVDEILEELKLERKTQ